MALLLTSVFGVTGCGSDDGEAPAESRIKNSTCYIAHSADSLEGEWSGGDNEFNCVGAGVYADEGSPGAGEDHNLDIGIKMSLDDDDIKDDTPPPSFIFLGDDIDGNDRYPSVSDDVEIGHPDFALRDAPEG